MIHHELYNTRSEAMRRERWYKTGKGHARVKEIITHYVMAKTAYYLSAIQYVQRVSAISKLKG